MCLQEIPNKIRYKYTIKTFLCENVLQLSYTAIKKGITFNKLFHVIIDLYQIQVIIILQNLRSMLRQKIIVTCDSGDSLIKTLLKCVCCWTQICGLGE